MRMYTWTSAVPNRDGDFEAGESLLVIDSTFPRRTPL